MKEGKTRANGKKDGIGGEQVGGQRRRWTAVRDSILVNKSHRRSFWRHIYILEAYIFVSNPEELERLENERLLLAFGRTARQKMNRRMFLGEDTKIGKERRSQTQTRPDRELH